MDKNIILENPADENLRPLKVGGEPTAIETASSGSGNGARVTGDLRVTGTVIGKLATTDLNIPASNKIYFDGGDDTYIYEHSVGDHLRIVVGDDILMKLSEAGNAGNLVNIGDACAGFTQHEPTFDADDTFCYFNRAGNKASLTFDGDNITDIHLAFPDVSCNCVLLVTQDGTGSRTITNWKTTDQSGGNESTVKFAGGSNPTLTTTADKTDIISFYWDNDNHRAYGVASLNF